MPSRKLYWVCECGRWSWEDKPACVGCQAKPPLWITQRRSGQTSKGSAISANGTQPAEATDLHDWIRQPNGRRKQAKARGAAAAAAMGTGGDGSSGGGGTIGESPAADASGAADGHNDADVIEVDDEIGNDDIPLADRLRESERKVSELESLGSAGRAAIPDFDNFLEAARVQRDDLLRERRAGRPTCWRLVEAEKKEKDRANGVDRVTQDLAALVAERAKVAQSIAAKESELAKAEAALRDAQGAVASVRSEIARAVDLDTSRAGAVPADLNGALHGLLLQIAALPAAFAKNNACDALQAVSTQAQAVAHITGFAAPIGTPSGDGGHGAHPMSAPDVARDSRSAMQTSGRRGTSPCPGATSDADSDASSIRSRSRERRDAERRDRLAASATGSQKLEEMGFYAHTTNDPYPADGGVGDHGAEEHSG